MMKLPDLKSVRNWILDFRRDVIRMMRLNFICVAMAILIGVFIVMLTAINMIMNTVSQSQSMALLRQIADSDRYNTLENFDSGMPPEPPPDGEIPPDGTMPPDGEIPPDGTMPSEGETPPPKPTEETISAAQPEADLTLLTYGRGDWQQGDWNNRPGQGGWEPQQPPNGGFDPNAEPTDFPDVEEPDEDYDDDDFEERPPWERSEDDRQFPTTVTAPPPTEPPTAEAPEQTSPPPATDAPAATEPPAPAVDAPAAETPAAIPADVPEMTEASSTPAETAAPETETVTETTTASETTSTTLPTEPTPPASDPFQNSQNPRDQREPRMDRWKVPITIDHFAILVSQDGAFLGLRNTEDYTDEEAQEIMTGILASEKSQGMYGWLQYCTAEKSYGTLIVVTDKTSDQGLLNNLFRTTVIIGILMLIVLLVILIFLSRWITAPVQQAFKRQKQFVSDAGHELKTPIAVLTTNADILQDEIGENKWLVYMQEQIGRMNQLVGDLLRLARMDNATQEYHFAEFDLSLAVAATTLPFESAAFEQRKTLEMDVQPDLRYNGSEQHIRQLCAIFIDNALKYSNDNGIIKVTLLQRGDHQILEFYNTGCEISQSETQKIFERFYRGDKARNSTKKSGYGLGLAIAKSIMDVHKIKFQVTCEQDKWIRFLLTF